MFVCCECCVLSGRGLCDKLRWEEINSSSLMLIIIRKSSLVCCFHTKLALSL
jgi:hypothetical protein